MLVEEHCIQAEGEGVCKLLSNSYCSKAKSPFKTLFPDTVIGINTKYAGQTTVAQELSIPYNWSIGMAKGLTQVMNAAGKFDQFMASFRDDCSSNGPGSGKKLSSGLVKSKIQPAKATD